MSNDGKTLIQIINCSDKKKNTLYYPAQNAHMESLTDHRAAKKNPIAKVPKIQN